MQFFDKDTQTVDYKSFLQTTLNFIQYVIVMNW